MKRLLTVLSLLAAVLLTGCTKAEGTYQEQLNQRIEQAITDATAGPTFSHGIYSFYKEPSVGRISSEETSSVFTQDGVKFVMNLNVSSIVNTKYYEGKSISLIPGGMEVLAKSGGQFSDFLGEEHPFEVTLYRMNDEVFTYMKTDLLEFFSISGDLQALQTAETMVRIARTVRVDREAVIAAYSSRQEINYERKRLELFQNVVPENGVIDELFEGNSNYAGIVDNYAGDNLGDNTETDQNVDFSMGDADDQIGDSFGDMDELPGQNDDAIPDQNDDVLPEGGNEGETGENGETAGQVG